MSDLIDRQAVIKAITNAADKWDCSDDYQRGIKAGIRMGTLISSVIPSAQPEIIRCKECLMHGVCRFEHGLGLDGYCSQAERRTDERHNQQTSGN